MNTKTEAQYFNGQSSSSIAVVATLNYQESEILIEIGNHEYLFWKFADLRFDQFGNLLEIRNEAVTDALLVIENDDFANEFYQLMKESKKVDLHAKLLKLNMPTIIAIALLLLCFVVVGYFYVLPPLAEKSAALLPVSIDETIGDIFVESFFDNNKVDSSKTVLLNEFANALKLSQTKSFHFTVVNSSEVNAFALPNGEIVVYSGILENMKSYHSLVALLGHESAHVNGRHSIKMLCRNLAGYLIISLLLTDVNGIMAVLADNAQQLHSLSFSRKYEQEADEEGLRIIFNNNANPEGMVELFDQLESEKKINIPKILSTHPLTAERKEHTQKLIADATGYTIVEDEKLKSIFSKLVASE